MNIFLKTTNLLKSKIKTTFPNVANHYKTINECLDIYQEAMITSGISEKTIQNRVSYINKIRNSIGMKRIRTIKPVDVSNMLKNIRISSPHTSKRVFMESRSFFNESLINGWIDFNPILQIKAPIAKVTRQRMTLEDWSVMFEYAKNNGTGWAWRLLLLALLTGQRRSDLSNMKFSDVYDEHLHVIQNKTGAKVAIPLSLRLDEVGLSIGEAIELCRGYTESDGQHDDYMIRKTTGGKPSLASLSARFEYIREQVFGKHLESNSSPFALHEIRSLSARLYYEHGEIEVQTLLGHASFKMTAMYINDRGKSRQLGKFKVVKSLRKD